MDDYRRAVEHSRDSMQELTDMSEEIWTPQSKTPHRAPLPVRPKYLLGQGRVLVFDGVLENKRGQARIYRGNDGLALLAQQEETPRWGKLLHISLSYHDHEPDHYPLKAVRFAMFPSDIDVMQVFPRKGEYYSLHPHCLHLFETPEEWRLVLL